MTSITRLEAMEIFSENLEEINDSLAENMKHALSLRPIPRDTDSQKFQLKSWLFILRGEQIKKKYTPMRRTISVYTSPHTEGKITQIDIDRAKEYPLEHILMTEVRRGMALCPLHNEKTPSFHVRKDNSFVCYGCGESGDAIDLYQKLNNVEFLEAVRKLT